MSSSVAWTGLPRAEAYGSSKAAIYYLMDTLRADLLGEIDELLLWTTVADVVFVSSDLSNISFLNYSSYS